MKEKDFQTKFTRWLRYRFPGVGAFELKLTKSSSLPFDAVQPHQIAFLLAVKNSGLEYKIPDDSRGTKPFDCFRLQGEAYVVVQYYSIGVKHFYLIDVDAFVLESQNSARKSLTESRAKEIGTTCEFA